ncbi:MAG: hypothetical protein ABI432_06970 [Flavobacteriales bacterium]
MKHVLAHIPANFWAGIVLITLLMFAALTANAQGRVIIKGQVLATTHTDLPVVATLEASNGETMTVLLERDGAFEVDVPNDDRYQLRFAQLGSTTKTIEVDTRDAFCKTSGKHRTVEFDVLLSAADSGDLLRYAGPVGRIAFDASNGELTVAHQYVLVMPTSVFVAENVE